MIEEEEARNNDCEQRYDTKTEEGRLENRRINIKVKD